MPLTLVVSLLDQGSGHTCSDNICGHNCTDLTEGFLCSCWPGYKPKATEKHNCEGTQQVQDDTPLFSGVHVKCTFHHYNSIVFSVVPLNIFSFITDINECEVYGTCPQECKNTKGSYECFCAEGFDSFGEPRGTECAAQGKGSAFTCVPFVTGATGQTSVDTDPDIRNNIHRKPTSAAFARQRSDSPFQPVL